MFNQLIIQYSSTKFSIEYAIQEQKTFKQYAPQDMATRIQQIFPEIQHQVYCQSTSAQFRLFFSNYQSRQTTSIVFVNGRYIQHPQIRQGINGEFIKPVNFVFDLKIFDANEIDFNCHPQKLFVIINQLDTILQSLHDEIHAYKTTHKQFTIQ